MVLKPDPPPGILDPVCGGGEGEMGFSAAQAQDPVRDGASQAQQAWRSVSGLARRVEAELRERLRREFGMSLARFEALAALHRADRGLRMRDLADALVTSNGNVTVLVEALVADALVARTIDDGDRRAAVIELTTRGRETFSAVAEAHAAWVADLLAGLAPDDLDRLAALAAAARKGCPAR